MRVRNAAFDHGTVGAQNLGNQASTLFGTDELKPTQSEWIDALAQNSERFGGGEGGLAAGGIELYGKAGGFADLVARDARHGFDDDELARGWVELEHAEI